MYENAFSSLIDALLLVSRDGIVLKSNPAAWEMFRRSPDALESHPIADLFPDPADVECRIEGALTAGESYSDLECLAHRNPGGPAFPAGLTISPLLGKRGDCQGAVVMVKDLSLLKELEEGSRQVSTLSTAETLALRMAHEIRNPLGGIRGAAQLLGQELTDFDQREYLDVVIAEVDRINRMVEQMMQLTRPAGATFKETNIHKVLTDIILLEKDDLARRKNRVEQVYDPSLPPIEADQDQLKQVFLNLIKNAAEASGKKGRIQILTRVNSGYGIKTRPQGRTRQGVVVEIIDSGTGMDAETLKNVFTPFFTTKKKGTGLGLALSLKIVENHSGKIKITSEKGLGTTVQVLLPIRQR
ncbi:MAG: PAS domain-containing protein [Nitrospinaceae bacterium]|nr:MAG: PAS domain-containing protein [Nitrospinaceae bacterium]